MLLSILTFFITTALQWFINSYFLTGGPMPEQIQLTLPPVVNGGSFMVPVVVAVVGALGAVLAAYVSVNRKKD